MKPKRKSSTLVVASQTPGRCKECRHSNQGTVDFAEGKLLCWIAKTPKRAEQECDVTLPLPSRLGQDPATFQTYYLFEPFDGENGTHGVSQDLRILAEDADDGLKKSLAADRPSIGTDLPK